MIIDRIIPVILAAGKSAPKSALWSFVDAGGRNPLEIAADNCAELDAAVVVLGFDAARLRCKVPHGLRVVVHLGWRSGQLSSLLAAVRRLPRRAAILVYPVDLVYLKKRHVAKIVAAFRRRCRATKVVMPRSLGRAGHPVIFAEELRPELARASTAREVAYRNTSRIQFVSLNTNAIWRSVDSGRRKK
ncbi:MAG: nucleotidyltransferase family protein [Candidatus Acidiferrales bacterium]